MTATAPSSVRQMRVAVAVMVLCVVVIGAVVASMMVGRHKSDPYAQTKLNIGRLCHIDPDRVVYAGPDPGNENGDATYDQLLFFAPGHPNIIVRRSPDGSFNGVRASC